MTAIPPIPHACGCLSGITSRQAVMLELAGMLEAVEWKVVCVRSAHELRDEPGDAEVVDRMNKTQLGLTRLRTYCQERGWNK